ncbi:MAG: DUF3800 domain-containing protein [Acidobacteriia bacterium]|nr:DUF3800 domain-containing protein [Terriglobia bacterium]
MAYPLRDMRIYIDEAGSFIWPPNPANSFSLVLALVVPAVFEDELFYEFLRLRDSWPARGIEIKGSSLDEKQAAEVVSLLTRYDVLMDFVAVDMITHPKVLIDDFKVRQADAITAHVTRDHRPELILQLIGMERTLREMPNQLFVQAELTIQLVLNVMQSAILYFVQRQPKELGDVAWIVDRKNHTITEMEETWTTIILPAGESHFMKEPFIALIGADYSFFERYEVDLAADEKMASHVDWAHKTYGQRGSSRTGRVIDAKRLLTEQLKFADSRDSLGLQLADILASILRRALNNRLGTSGWAGLGKLVVHDPEPGWFVQLGEGIVSYSVPDRAVKVWRTLKARSKPMVP